MRKYMLIFSTLALAACSGGSGGGGGGSEPAPTDTTTPGTPNNTTQSDLKPITLEELLAQVAPSFTNTESLDVLKSSVISLETQLLAVNHLRDPIGQDIVLPKEAAEVGKSCYSLIPGLTTGMKYGLPELLSKYINQKTLSNNDSGTLEVVESPAAHAGSIFTYNSNSPTNSFAETRHFGMQGQRILIGIESKGDRANDSARETNACAYLIDLTTQTLTAKCSLYQDAGGRVDHEIKENYQATNFASERSKTWFLGNSKNQYRFATKITALGENAVKFALVQNEFKNENGGITTKAFTLRDLDFAALDVDFSFAPSGNKPPFFGINPEWKCSIKNINTATKL